MYQFFNLCTPLIAHLFYRYLFCLSTYSFTDLIDLSFWGFLVLVRTLNFYFYINLTKKIAETGESIKIGMRAPKYDDFYVFWWINYWFFLFFEILEGKRDIFPDQDREMRSIHYLSSSHKFEIYCAFPLPGTLAGCGSPKIWSNIG